MATTTTPKSRHWATIVYPDSAQTDWLDILADLHICAFVSPLHDRDVANVDTGELKKPHYHVLMSYDGPTTRKVAQEAFSSFGGVGAELVRSQSAYARYLCHLDEQDKVKYPISDVRELAGADYNEVIQTNVDRLTAIEEMQDWCEQNGITSYAALNRYARHERRDWFRVLNTSATVAMTAFLKSLKWERDNGIS